MTDIDLSKVIMDSRKGAFKNNNIYTGSFQITGTWTPGYQVGGFNVTLADIPDMVVVMFQAPTDNVYGSDPRPNGAWFKNGYAWVRGDNHGAGYDNYPIPFKMSMAIIGNTAQILWSSVNQTAVSMSMTPTTVYYRIIDYSVL